MRLFRNRRKRVETLQRFAQENSLLFEEKDELGFIKYFHDFKLFRRGGHRKIRCLMRSTLDDYQGDQGLFDYHYIIQSGNTPVPFNQTVFYCINKSLALPHFRMFPEKFRHTIGKWFGMQDIDFPIYPDFSKHFILRGVDEARIRSFFGHDDVVKHFNAHQDWTVEGIGFYVIMYQDNKLLAGTHLNAMLSTGKDLATMLINRSRDLDVAHEV